MALSSEGAMSSTGTKVVTITQPNPTGAFQEGLVDSVQVSTGTTDGSKYVITDANGKIDLSLLPAGIALTPLTISISNNHTLQEIGSSVSSVTVTWSESLPVVSQSLNQGATALTATQTSFTFEFPDGLKTDITFTLTASTASATASASTSSLFEAKTYFGPSAVTTLTNAEILALSGSQFATSRNLSTSFNCTGGAFPVVAYPSSFGNPANVTVGGLAFSSFTLTTQSVTNASGFTQDYTVLVFINEQTGSNITFSLS
jgi:hypothetical protein